MPADALVLAPETPYPLAGGGPLRTASLLHYLRRKYETDLIVFREPGAPDPCLQMPAGLVRRVFVVDLPVHRRDAAARVMRNGLRLARRVPPLVDRFAGFERSIARALHNCRYDVGIVEHFWCAPYGDLLAAHCARTVLDLHNVESHLHHRCAVSEPAPSAFAHRVFRQAALDLERHWLPRFSQVLTPSTDDAQRALAIAPSAHVAVYPNAIPFPDLPECAGEESLVFSGNMQYHPNLSAARHFAATIWPALRRDFPQLRWRIVGKNPGAVSVLAANDPRIEITGPVEDAVAEIARSRVAVVPLLAGSGTRFKILEAWAAGVPVVSTAIGAEGLGARDGEHLLLADTAAEFASAVARLLKCSNLRSTLSNAGRLLLQKEFTWEAAWRNLDL